MVLTKSEARARIEQELSKIDSDADLVVLDELTREYEWGWIFFYQSRQYVETGDTSSMVAGNAPLIVNRSSGQVSITGTARSIEEYVRDYEADLKQNAHGAA